MSMRASYTVENVLHYSIRVSNHLLNKAFKLLRYLKSAVHGEAHARAEWLKNKLYGSTLNSN